MNAHNSPSWRIGHIGCSRGPPSGRIVARNPSPGPNWYSSSRPAAAMSGASRSYVAQVATSAGGDRDADAVAGCGGHRDELAPQEVRPGTDHPHLGERTSTHGGIAGEVHELVLPRATGEDVGVLLARPFNEDLLGASDARVMTR